jgi:hypothetical protein
VSILFEIPEAFSSSYKLGKVIRYGTVLKDVKTGNIVAHLTESKNLIDLVSKAPTNPVQMVTGLVDAASSIAANYQLYNQNIKIDFLTEQVTSLAGLTKSAFELSGVGAIASVATFALCATKFKAIDNRLNNIEKKIDLILDRLQLAEKNNEKREIRSYLCEIRSSFDYLIPTASESRIEHIQQNLSRGFTGINSYLQDKIQVSAKDLEVEDVIFLYNTLIITAMGEFRGFVILNDTQGAKHILQKRRDDLRELKKLFIQISKSKRLDSNISTNQLDEFKSEFATLVDNVTSCYADFDSQLLIVNEYIHKENIPLKKYYENIENNDKDNGVIVIHHKIQ